MSRIKKIWIAAGVLLGLLLLGAGIYAGRLYYVAKYAPRSAFSARPTPAQAEPSPVPAVSGQSPAPAAPTPIPSPTQDPEEALAETADFSFLKDTVNILVLGWDHSPERDDEDNVLYRDEDNNFRSDVLILLAVDFEQKSVDMISIPRDSYYRIYNTPGKWKINAAFAKGGSAEGEGFAYAMNTVSNLFGGLPIHYYCGVEMEGLKALGDALGGVEFDVDARIVLNGRVLEKGPQVLSGQQILDYCRARKGYGTDVDRCGRQQKMLFAMFNQIKKANLFTDIPRIYSALSDKIYTNLNLEQIAALAYFGMGLSTEDIHAYTLKGKYEKAYGVSFYLLDQSYVRKLAKDVFGLSLKKSVNRQFDIEYIHLHDRARTLLSDAEAYLKAHPLPADTPEEVAAGLDDALKAMNTALQTDSKKEFPLLDEDGMEKAALALQEALDSYQTYLASPSPQPDPQEDPPWDEEAIPEIGPEDQLPSGDDEPGGRGGDVTKIMSP